MHYVILARDVPGSGENRQAARPAHLARLEELAARGRLLIAGPLPAADGSPKVIGSLIVADFESLEAAREWAAEDPYQAAGVYQSVEIQPFKKVLP